MWEDVTPILMCLTHSKQATERSDYTETDRQCSMLVVFYCSALVYWTTRCVALHVSDGQQLIPGQDPHMTASSTESGDGLEIKNHIPHLAPCFVDDIFAALLASVGNNGELTNNSFTLFGICMFSENSPGSILSELVTEANRNLRSRMWDFHPVGVHFSEEGERRTLQLTFDLPPVLKPNPVLLLAFKSPLMGGNLDVTFTGQPLQPDTQSVCISGETQFLILTGKLSEGSTLQKWRISVDTEVPDMKQTLKDLLIGGKPGSSIRITPLLLFSGERATGTRYPHVPGSLTASSQTSFLCELKRFLGDVVPQDHPESSPLQLTTLQSLPPLPLGISSSETLLSGLINSSTITIFSFSSCCSVFQMHHGELVLSAGLLQELRQRLEQAVVQIMGIIEEEELGHRAMERLGRLIELSALSKTKLAAGESQYRAFLLLKALQTMTRMYEVKRGLRATRAGPNNPVRGEQCGLRSLVVSLEEHVIGPNTANINNCHGSCAVPLVNPSNHAVLLNSHIESERAVTEHVDERAPCCVPVAYEDLDMVLLNAHGTGTELRCLKYVVAKECGCR